MIRFFKVALVLFFGLLISCTNDDAATQIPPIPYGLQYPVDIAAIEKFLDEYTMDISNDGELDVTFTKIVAGDGEISIMDQTDHPLQSKIVNSNGVDYKVYYLNVSGHKNEDHSNDIVSNGVDKQPTRVDSVFVSYKGHRLDNFVFGEANDPTWLQLGGGVIQGWSEIIPFFKSGNYDEDPLIPGNILFTDFGAGVMFLPSGLGYYNNPNINLPAYSPLIFSFKLKAVNYVDSDYDGIDSKDEDLNGDGMYYDDTDGDGVANFMDTDDDGDGFLTKVEIRKPRPILVGQGPSYFYPVNPFTVVDDPLTAEDESVTKSEPKGIPDASGDGTTPTRVRRHLDRNAIPPYTTY